MILKMPSRSPQAAKGVNWDNFQLPYFLTPNPYSDTGRL